MLAFGSSIRMWGAEPVPQLVPGISAGYSCIIPVPASGRKRGYNVPCLMALPLEQALGVPLYSEALERTRAKRHQAGLPFEERFANVAGAFRVRRPEQVDGKRILLVDDVVTTGATAAACTQALLAAGAESVFILAMAVSEIDGLPKKAPDLLIYLEGSFDHIMYNIKKRGRDFEQPDDENGLTDYYKLLHKHYTKWYEDYQYSPKMKINTDNFDVTKPEDWDKVYQMIRQEMKSIGIGD